MQNLDQCFDVPGSDLAQANLQRFKSIWEKRASADQSAALLQKLSEGHLPRFHRLALGSEYAINWLCHHPDEFLALLDQDLNTPNTLDAYRLQLSAALTLAPAEWDAQLRRIRNRAMCGIIWRDLNRLVDTMTTTAELTALADAVVAACLDYHYHRLAETLGVPTSHQGHPQPMLVIGMGKLGAHELNLSSDIDLIFAFPRSGETRGVDKPLSNQEFFIRLGQAIIKSLDPVSADGFVFRVDMRLRPYGQSGTLASSFGALEDYYQTQGREWERFAMIKARIMANNGSRKYTEELQALLRQFTYRKYVDFTAIEALRNLKHLINKEVKRRRLQDNIKLGRGGIREIEFIAQAFQIIRGGRDTVLQERRLLSVLPLLVKHRCLPPGLDQALAEAYLFLRNVEHALQAWQDKQTQQLPTDATACLRLALVMGFADRESFLAELDRHRDRVHEQFSAMIAEPRSSDARPGGPTLLWRDLWSLSDADQQDLVAELTKLGFEQPEAAIAVLRNDLLVAPAVVAMAATGRERLNQLLPLLLQRLSRSQDPTRTLTRLVKLLTAVARRSVYLTLLIENPGALDQLVTLSEASPWIADRLAGHPALLDELLNPAALYTIPTLEELTQELRSELLRVDEHDLEGQMEALRYFRQSQSLQAAACELTGRLPLMKVSDYLTELAEVLLAYVLHMSWQQMVARHGVPAGESATEPNFLIVGYGKLGGIELAHGSDLDLVFIHDADPNGQTAGDAEGNRVIDTLTFYMRLGQKIIHILNANTPSGQLYEVDMRLRPSGNSGLLVTSLTGFRKYQEESAWTWEHQALVRARVIVGPAALATEFADLRHHILTRERDPARLREDVLGMRQKMREQLGSNARQRAEGRFDLKQDTGGIVDIEFLVQYAVLAWSSKHPQLTRYPDNIRILEGLLAADRLDAQEVNHLIEAYKAFRSMGHRLTLQQQPAVIDESSAEPHRQNVIRIWQSVFGSAAET